MTNHFRLSSKDIYALVTVVCAGCRGELSAPLQDFRRVRTRPIEACRRGNREAGYPGAWPKGRCK